MNNKRFSGIMPAMITPIHADGTLRAESAAKLIDWELTKGIQGFYINGSTGEGPVLGEKTRMEMAELSVAKTKGRGVVINHVGAPDTNTAIRLAKHAYEIGCDAISSVVPNFYYTYSDDEIIDYYKMLSDACPLPLLVYATGLIKTSDVRGFIDRVMKEVPTAIGLKYTMPNYYQMHRICELNGGDINVINGPDEMLICGLTMGADGGIGSTYNLMPDWFEELYCDFQNGKFQEAREMQFKINRVIAALLKHGCIPSVKEALNVMGFDVGAAAIPAKVFDAERTAALVKDLKEAGYSLER